MIKTAKYLVGQDYPIIGINSDKLQYSRWRASANRLQATECKMFPDYFVLYVGARAIKVYSKGWHVYTKLNQEFNIDKNTGIIHKHFYYELEQNSSL